MINKTLSKEPNRFCFDNDYDNDNDNERFPPPPAFALCATSVPSVPLRLILSHSIFYCDCLSCY